jgi:hypothetical protein
MASNKKSVILYIDLIHVIEKMSNEDAGLYFKHLLRYINDLNPEPPSLLIEIAFESHKQQLKRDLKGWEEIKAKRSIAGQISAEKRKLLQQEATNSTHVESVQHNATNPTVSVNVNDTVNVTVNDNVNEDSKETPIVVQKFNFRKELENLGIEKEIVNTWIEIRKRKRAVNSEIAFNAIKREIEKTNLTANECILKAVEKSWVGFEAKYLDNLNNSSNANRRVNHSAEDLKRELEERAAAFMGSRNQG